MYARISTVYAKPGKIDELVAIFQEGLTHAHDDPEARQGHKETYLLVDRENSKVVALGFFETEASMRANVTSKWNKELAERITERTIEAPQREFFKVEVQG